jgi:hypothetical protein
MCSLVGFLSIVIVTVIVMLFVFLPVHSSGINRASSMN